MASPRSEIEELHRLVDALPADDVPRARRLLARMRLERTLRDAPDGPPETDDQRASARDARDEAARDGWVSHEEVKRELDGE